MLALIPLRKGSKRIKNKNIKEMLGQPLFYYVLEEAVKSGVFDKIVVSTDSLVVDYLVNLRFNVDVHIRPKELGADETTTEDVMLDVAKHYDFDSICTIQATSPTTTARDFIKAKEIYEKELYDSLLTVVETSRLFWFENQVGEGQPLNYDPQTRKRSQEFKSNILMESGNFYMTERDLLMKEKCRLGGYIGFYKMTQDNRYEIDTLEDWEEVEKILKRRVKNERMFALRT